MYSILQVVDALYAALQIRCTAHNLQMTNIPYWEKYMLTLREAAEYFHIGEKKLRQIVEENMDADFLLTSGNRIMIKRKLFEEFLDSSSVI